MKMNLCVVRGFCTRVGREPCVFYETGQDGECIFLNEEEGWCCSPAAVEDAIRRAGLVGRNRGGSDG